ncbi:right-handed parallel beta-helix repeat-containing protein [Niallia alba]|uniref:right-handed parallel beta-helix repeat-containing protein n=1 Tax=Niallia alba TaxID=2729105 RepID=UPI002E204BB1|nr:right-handed parallel beta-helix repeat-containing protein [Niallia alba]
MDTNKPFYDPLITQGRTGKSDSPFVDIQETLYIVNGKALVTEIPDEFHKVRIIESKIPLFEIKKGVPKENEYIVNYNRGYITFGQLFNGERIVVKYKGTGTQKIPDSRTYLTEDTEFELLSDKLKDIDRKDNEQKNRVDTLITENPQPSEVVDNRVDMNGKVYETMRERTNAIQKEVEDARLGKFGDMYSNLKDRLFEIDQTIRDESAEVDVQVHVINDKIDSIKNSLLLREVNVKVLGAIGNGIADDTAVIQTALNTVYQQGGGIVVVPSGKYKLTSSLFIGSNVYLSLNKNAQLIRFHNDDFIVNFSKVKGSSKLTGYNGESNITIDGGIWDNQGDLNDSGQCMLFAHAKNIKVTNAVILDVKGGHAIEFNGIDGGIIDNVEAYGFNGQTFRGAFQIDLDKTGTPPTLGDYGSLDSTPCKNIEVKNCKVGKSKKMNSWGRGVETHNATIGVSHENISIHDNYFENTIETAIRAYAWNNISIKKNRMVNCGAGIIINPPLLSKPEDLYDLEGNLTNNSQSQSQISIIDNEIDGSTMTSGLSSGIGIWGQANNGTLYNVIVTNNVVKRIATNANGIYLKRVEKAIVSNNIIEDIGHNGISITASRKLIINDNILDKIGITGIYCKNDEDGDASVIGEDISIISNKVNNCGGHGIHMETNKDALVNNNTVRDVGSLENNRYNGIFISTNCSNISVSANSVIMANKKLISGISITSTNTTVYDSNNYVPFANFFFGKTIDNSASTYKDYYEYNTLWSGSASGVNDIRYQLTETIENYDLIRITYSIQPSVPKVVEFSLLNSSKTFILQDVNLPDSGGTSIYTYEAALDFTNLTSFVISRDLQINAYGGTNSQVSDVTNYTIRKIEGKRD